MAPRVLGQDRRYIAKAAIRPPE